MKKFRFATLFTLLLLSVFVKSQTPVLFYQEFNGAVDEIPVNVFGEITHTDYVSATPDTAQFTSIIAGKNSASYLNMNSISSGECVIHSENSSFQWCASRTVNFSSMPNVVMLEMRSKHDITSSGSTGKFTILFGSGLVDDPYTATPLKPNNANVHSGFMMQYAHSTNGAIINDYAGTSALNGSNMSAQENTYTKWTFVINNSGSAITYPGPNGSSENLANDCWDLWFDNTKWIDDSPATTGTQNLGQFKIGDMSNQGRADWNIDYIKILDYSAYGLPKLPSPNVTAATAITTTGLTANWDAVVGATGYIVNLYQGTTLINSYTVGAGVLNQPFSALLSNSTYTIKVIAQGDGITNQNSPEASGTTARTVSTEKSILTFELLGAIGVINEGAKTIAVTVPHSTILPGSYEPYNVLVSNYATLLTTGLQPFVVGAPGTPFTVQAEDLTTQNYTVTLTKAPPSSACNLTTFSILGIPEETVVFDGDTVRVTVAASQSAAISSIPPARFTISPFANESPDSTLVQDFTNLVKYTITAEDGSTQKEYTIKTTFDGTAPTLTSSNPSDTDTNASLAGMITLNYDENLHTGAGAVSISGGILGAPSIIGNRVTIPFSGLTSLTPYTITVPAGVYTDIYGNPVAGTTINFTTGDGVLRTLPYASHMDGASYAVPAYISPATAYDENADCKASTTTQYGAYVLAPSEQISITTDKVGSILATVYAPGVTRTFTITDNISGLPITTGSISGYNNKGTSLQRTINSTGTTVITITNTSAIGEIYIPYIYIDDLGQPMLSEKEVWCK